MIEIGLGHYLSLGAIIFFLGTIGIFLNFDILKTSSQWRDFGELHNNFGKLSVRSKTFSQWRNTPHPKCGNKKLIFGYFFNTIKKLQIVSIFFLKK